MAEARSEREFDTQRVIANAVEVCRTGLLPLALIALVIVGTAVFAGEMLIAELPADEDGDFFLTSNFWVSTLLETAAIGIVQAILAYSFILKLNGRQADLAGSLVAVSGLLLPLIGLVLLSNLFIILGFVALVIPGIILSIRYSVSIAVFVQERRGMFDSLQRSGELTKGSEWPIFFLLLAWTVLTALLEYSSTSLAAGFIAEDGPLATPVFAACYGLASSATSVAGAALFASLYVELRTAKEGTSEDKLANLFA